MAVLVYSGADGLRRFQLGERSTLGRGGDCDLVLSHSTVSRRHAVVAQVEGRYRVEDQGSRFGCFLNGQPVQGGSWLSHGDELRLGEASLRFEDDPEITQPPGHPLAPSLPSQVERVRELEQRLFQLERSQRKNQALLALSEVFLKCTSAAMILKLAGSDLLSAARADRGLIVLREGSSGELAVQFAHQLGGIPAHRHADLARVLASGAVRETKPDSEGRVAVIAPFQGRDSGAQGMIYVELPPGRPLAAEDADLFNAMCGQISTAVANLSLQQRVRQEEQARANLSRYVSTQVAEAVLSGKIDLHLGGEQRRVTVLFFDVRGFTSLSERLSPEHVLQILNECFAEAVPIIKGAQGTVDKFIGDSLMAVFGAPNELSDQALRAVRAAREIRRALRELGARWVARPWASQLDPGDFGVGIGINTGMVVAGNLGTEERKEYAVIGDAVNVASRLCATAKRDQIIIGPETAAQVSGQVRLSELGPLKVKGREQAVRAFEVADEPA